MTEVPLATSAVDAEPELLTFEIETYETTVLYEEPVNPSKEAAPPAPRGKGTPQPRHAQNPTSILPLDPLFDEDD